MCRHLQLTTLCYYLGLFPYLSTSISISLIHYLTQSAVSHTSTNTISLVLVAVFTIMYLDLSERVWVKDNSGYALLTAG